MKNFNGKIIVTFVLLLTAFTAGACGKSGTNEPESFTLSQLAEPIPGKDQTSADKDEASEGQSPNAQSSSVEASEKGTSETESKDSGAAPQRKNIQASPAGGSLIREQTFQVTLQPLGAVVFASYRPDTSQDPNADVVFSIEKDGAVLQKLPGLSENNSHDSGAFLAVEAVSFLDYNNDGYDDIITICSYRPSGGQTDTNLSEIRYYSGSQKGTFTFEKQMSENACQALVKIDMAAAKDFIGAGKGSSLEPWQEAYIDFLTRNYDTADQAGYTYAMIYINNDEIPELVEIGDCEATGCRIISFSNGTVHSDQLNRLYFSYIEKGNLLCNAEGNMDYYYDLVYRLGDNGLVLIASGYYGAEDNSNVQYDEAGNPIYYYQWEGVEMSAEDYARSLNSVYDVSLAADGYSYDERSSIDEMIVMLENF